MAKTVNKPLKLNLDRKYTPAHDVVFSIMFGKNHLFKKLIKAISGEDIELIGDTHTQANIREDDVLLNSIRLDILGETTDGYRTADMQIEYKYSIIVKRMIYYACRLISTQPVDNMRYDKLKSVAVAFIMAKTEAPNGVAVNDFVITNKTTGEEFSDLCRLNLVYVPTVIEKSGKDSDIYVFSRFFEITRVKQATQFVVDFKDNELAKELIFMYNTAVANRTKLLSVEQQPYFTEKLTRKRMAELRAEGKAEGEAVGIAKGEVVGFEKAIKAFKSLGLSDDMIQAAVKNLKSQPVD